MNNISVRKFILLLVISSFSSIPTPFAVAATASSIEVRIEDSNGQPVFIDHFSCDGIPISTPIQINSGYSAVTCPTYNHKMNLGISFLPNDCPIKTSLEARLDCVPYSFLDGNPDVNKGSHLLITLPPLKIFTVNFYDALNNPTSGDIRGDGSWGELQSDFFAAESTWVLGERLVPAEKPGWYISSTTGSISFAIYETNALRNIKSGFAESGWIDLKTTSQIKLCLPVNLAPGAQLPSDCYDGKRILEKMNADKAAADALAAQQAAVKVPSGKSAVDTLGAQPGIAKSVQPKKTLIVCIKGKITKKVAGLMPTCPSGYKKK
jgi:hypothetical protein